MRASNDYHDLLLPLDDAKLVGARGLNARAFGQAVQANPLAAALVNGWNSAAAEPFHGLTCDGHCEPGLFRLRDEGAPSGAAAAAARNLLDHLPEVARRTLRYPMDAVQWRLWSNPEFLVNDYGLRLEDIDQAARELVLRVLAESLSTQGFQKARGCMHTNAFLGDLTQLQNLMNEWSYNFILYGEPSSGGAWGWNLYGHHLCLNCVFVGDQMVLTPVFMGAEPNVIDAGPYAGTTLFTTQQDVGLEMMQSFDETLRGEAQIYASMKYDPAMPADRYHPADGLHLGGAFQDNRIVPQEGVSAARFDDGQRRRLMRIAEAFLEILPDQPRALHLGDIERFLDRTTWAWIGGHGPDDPFYYRIQSPVIMLEFDHHPGVWLANDEPAKCHIHTVMRTPNGNDYGKDLLRQHYAAVHPGSEPGRD